MSDIIVNNYRIAKNTLVIYANMFLNMVIGLVSSRLVLQALGVSDYGLYNVMGGIVVLFAFISNSLSSTTVRFVNVEKGKPDGDVNRVFNVCRMLHIVLALLLLLLVELGGIYYIHHFLKVDPGKESDAMFVFQVAAVMWCAGVMNVPYSSLFNAHEKFLFNAIVNLAGRLIVLGLLFGLLHYGGNRLRAYALIMMVFTLLQFLAFHVFSYHYWPSDVKWKLVRDWPAYKEVIAFSNYNLLSSTCYMARGQGSALLINFFFGTAVNGAYAVAKTVGGYLESFCNNIQRAAAPQVTQSYSGGDLERVYYLMSRTGKYAMLLLLLVFFPLWAELDFVMGLWLGEVPEGALVFTRLTLLMAFLVVTDGGIGLVVSASGRVARFRTVYSIITLACVPLGFLILKAGAPAHMLLVLFVVADIIWRIVQLVMASRILLFPVGRYCRDTYLPVLIVCAPMALILILTSLVPSDTTLWHLTRFFILLILTAVLSFVLGLKKSERTALISKSKKKTPTYQIRYESM